MPKHIAIVGKKGTGKSSLESELVNKYGFNKAISDTTRKPRKGEVNHKDYHFISDEEFEHKLNIGQYVEFVSARGCHYGIDKDEVKDNPTVFVVDVDGLLQLISNGIDVFTIDLFCNDRVRLERIINRDGLPDNHDDLIDLIINFNKDSIDFAYWYKEEPFYSHIDLGFNTERVSIEDIAKEVFIEYVRRDKENF